MQKGGLHNRITVISSTTNRENDSHLHAFKKCMGDNECFESGFDFNISNSGL